MPDLQRELPESVRGMIQRKVDQLSTADRHLLMAASVQGPEFDSAVVARLLGREPADVEERLEVLERVHYLVRLVREQAFPDGTLTVRYGFVHVLYQNALYAALQPTRKAAWSAAAARALLGHYGEKSAGLAAELAMLFEAARDHERATDYYLVAAENAARIFAHHEAVALARRGLALIETLPDTPELRTPRTPLASDSGRAVAGRPGFRGPGSGAHLRPRPHRCANRCRKPDGSSRCSGGCGCFTRYAANSGMRGSWPSGSSRSPKVPRIRPSSSRPARRWRPRRSAWATRPPRREHMEQGIALYDPKRHAQPHRPLRAGPRQWSAWPSGQWPSGCSATRTRRCDAARRRSPWARSCGNPARSRWRCTSPPCSGSTAARGRRSRGLPRR